MFLAWVAFQHRLDLGAACLAVSAAKPAPPVQLRRALLVRLVLPRELLAPQQEALQVRLVPPLEQRLVLRVPPQELRLMRLGLRLEPRLVRLALQDTSSPATKPFLASGPRHCRNARPKLQHMSRPCLPPEWERPSGREQATRSRNRCITAPRTCDVPTKALAKL